MHCLRAASGLLLMASLAVAREAEAPVTSVPYVDLERYAGKWFEIARLPTRFQHDCAAATAEYEVLEGRRLGIVNTCYRSDGSTRSIEGEARPVDATNARLKVTFDNLFFKLFSWLVKADYWVIELDEDYRYAVVGTPKRDYLWILHREPEMESELYQRLVAGAAAQGFHTARLVRSAPPPSPAP